MPGLTNVYVLSPGFPIVTEYGKTRGIPDDSVYVYMNCDFLFALREPILSGVPQASVIRGWLSGSEGWTFRRFSDPEINGIFSITNKCIVQKVEKFIALFRL